MYVYLYTFEHIRARLIAFSIAELNQMAMEREPYYMYTYIYTYPYKYR